MQDIQKKIAEVDNMHIIEFNKQTKVWSVQGDHEEVYNVKLNPLSCDCPFQKFNNHNVLCKHMIHVVNNAERWIKWQ